MVVAAVVVVVVVLVAPAVVALLAVVIKFAGTPSHACMNKYAKCSKGSYEQAIGTRNVNKVVVTTPPKNGANRGGV